MDIVKEYAGWYSAKYDSTKQRKVMTGDEDSRDKYITSIRFEMLLAGKIVITDAQWYDGMFFWDMAVNRWDEFEEFKAFINEGVLKNAAPLEIRRRKNICIFFMKELWSSVISEPKLRAFVYDLFVKFPPKVEYDDFIKMLKYMENIVDTNAPKLSKAFSTYKMGVKKLHEINIPIFKPWGKPFIPEFMKKIQPELLEMLKKIKRNKAIFNEVKYSVALIEDEILKEFPKRSIIVSELKTISDCVGNYDFENTFMHIFDHNYNLAIARQHGCKYYDLCDALSGTKFDKNTMESDFVDEQEFHSDIVEYLSSMTWSEFGEVFYDAQVVKIRNEWLTAFDGTNVKKTKKVFLKYLDCIVKKIEGLGIQMIDKSIFYKPHSTKRFFFHGCSKMVGGAASDYHIDSEGICLFFGGDLRNLKDEQLVRYATTQEYDRTFDTVFAPIEKVIAESGN